MRFPSLFRALRGRKVEDRGRESYPSFLIPPPVPPTVSRYESLRFGITYCPECNAKVSVLVNGICRDCGPDDAA